MSGIKDLNTLLQSMSPMLNETEYVFCTIPDAQYGDYADLNPIASYQEQEGLTLVVPKNQADNENLSYEGVFQAITLTVHSSLDAVGLTAAVATKLTEHNISANVIAAFYHDHIFVQQEKARAALRALQEFQKK